MEDGVLIPLDLLYHIFEHGGTFKDRRGLHLPGLQFLHNVALVSRDWCYVSRKLEFRSHRILPSRLAGLITFLSSPFQTLVPHIRYLAIAAVPQSKKDYCRTLLSTFVNLPSLETLVLHHFMWPASGDITRASIPRRLELKRLEIRDMRLVIPDTKSGGANDCLFDFLSWFSVIGVLVMEGVRVGLSGKAYAQELSRRNHDAGPVQFPEDLEVRELILRGDPHESILAFVTRPQARVPIQRISLELENQVVKGAFQSTVDIMARWLVRLHCCVSASVNLSLCHQLETLELYFNAQCRPFQSLNSLLATLPTQLNRLTISPRLVTIPLQGSASSEKVYSLFMEMDYLLSRFASRRALPESQDNRDLDLAVSISLVLPLSSGQSQPRASVEARLRDALSFVAQRGSLKLQIIGSGNPSEIYVGLD